MIGRRDFFFMPALLISILTPLSVPSSSVSLSYFILTVRMRECFIKHSCMSSTFPIAILHGTCLFPTVHAAKCRMSIRRENLEIVKHW